MKSLLVLLAVALMLFISPTTGTCYEIKTHWQLSVAAYEMSVLKDAIVRGKLGIDRINESQIFKATQQQTARELLAVTPTCDPKSFMKLRQLLFCGAMYEDIPGTRSLNHFFDPISGGPITIDGSRPGDWVGYPNMTSPDWSLQDNNSSAYQWFSYRRARGYFINALVTGGQSNAMNGRNAQWGFLFQSLGHVIHHVQDMAQPQHTRNDPHTDWFSSLFGSTAFGMYRHPSRFEKYSVSDRGAAKIDLAITQAMAPVYPTYADHFKRPRDFWTGSNRGLADYTNRNFLSQLTNFTADEKGGILVNTKFKYPVPSGASTLPVTAAFSPDPVPASVALLCDDIGIWNCEMKLYANQWSDPLSSAAKVNTRASTESIFDEDLNLGKVSFSWDDGLVATSKIFALHRVNFDAAYPHLIPRAVAYSAGVINYFFRGQMDIRVPVDGVYALVDHHAQRCKDNCGFRTVKLVLQNTTPGEDMSAGNLRAVAKFRRNKCYRDDLSGDPGGPGFAGVSCRSAQEEIVVSDLLPLQSMLTQESRELKFTFPNAIPINATDLYLQVVFQGTLGQEPDAVAVATKDISEPNYFAFTNVTDKAYDFVDHTYHALPYKSSPAPDPIFGVSIAFRDGAPPLAQITQLDAANHAQLAFLTDPGRQFVDIRYSSHRYTVGSPIRGTIPVSEFVGDPDTSTYGRTVVFTPSRGMYRNFYEYHRLPPDFTIYDCRVEVELCAQLTMIPFTPAGAVEWTINF